MSRKPSVYLLDVEGTIAPISLVAEQLFPYARRHFEPFLREHIGHLDPAGSLKAGDLDESSVLYDVALLVAENRHETDSTAPRIFNETAENSSAKIPGIEGAISSAAAIPRILDYACWLMDRDRKSTALKALQGRIWKTGFETGELKGTLFPDVPDALHRWSSHGRIAIYSSGSVEAQKLLFRYSTFGDLSARISHYFDTRSGAKTAASSYATIASALNVAPGAVCFFSDVARELDPARQAGMDTRLVVRPGNPPIAGANGHQRITSMGEIG